MRWALGALAALAVTGCGDAPAPAPELRGLTPSQATSDDDVSVEISGTGLMAKVVTDFNHATKSALDVTFVAALTPQDADASQAIALLDVRLTPAATLQATVPAGVPRGTYDLKVIDPEQRSMTLLGAYRVVASAETVAGFRIDAIGPQRAGSSFTVSLAAVDPLGRVVDGFVGSASLSDLSGTLTPTDTGPFVLGRSRVLVMVSTPLASDTLTVTDALGHASIAEAFEVKTGLAVALKVRSQPQTLVAGECSSPLEVELADVFGKPAQAEAPLSLAFEAGPLDDVRFFSDAACTAPSPMVALGPSDSLVSVYFLTLRAGSPTLRVNSEAFPSASQPQTVSPSSPVSLSFSTPGQSVKAGACSAAVRVQAVDAHGNPSPVAEDLPLSIAMGPGTSANARLHADADCATPLATFAIAAGTSSSTLYFQGTAEGALWVELTSTLGTALQEETIAP